MTAVDDHAGRAPCDGLLVVDKPAGLTSAGVVARLRRLAATRKVGHAGTLDPMATGLLLVGIGASTRLLTFFVGAAKGYRATVRLGWGTVTDDAEGEPLDAPRDVSHLTQAQVQDVLTSFVGEIDQVPSSVSAVKVAGRRAYAIVRSGEKVDLPPRRVTIERIDVGSIRRVKLGESGPTVFDLDIDVACSSGTYIRAIARDLGQALGVGGHLTALRRHTLGPFTVEEAVTLPRLDDDGVARHILSPARAAVRIFPPYDLDAGQARDLSHGRRVQLADGVASARVAAIDPEGRLVGIAERHDGYLRSVVNFPPAPRPAGTDSGHGEVT